MRGLRPGAAGRLGQRGGLLAPLLWWVAMRHAGGMWNGLASTGCGAAQCTGVCARARAASSCTCCASLGLFDFTEPPSRPPSSPPPPPPPPPRTHVQEVERAIDMTVSHVNKLREMSPLWEMVQEGVDIKSIQWAQH